MTRESLAIEVDVSLRAQRVVAVLERLAGTHGVPNMLSVDHGPECTSRALDAWAHRHGVKLAFSPPGTPPDNPFLEAFNVRLREACLNLHWFASVEEAGTTIEAWCVEYNTARPHTACPTKRQPCIKPIGSRSRRFKPPVTNLPSGPKFGCGPNERTLIYYVAQFSGGVSGLTSKNSTITSYYF
jgi:putative transposase